MTCDHKLTNHNVNQFQPITAVHSQITTCEVKGYVTTVGDKLSVLAGFIANLTLTDSVNIDLCGWYSSNITCLFLLVYVNYLPLTAQFIVTIPVIKIKFVQHMENTNLCIVTSDLLVFMSGITLPVTSLSILLWLILRINPKYLLCLINLT